MLQRSAVDIRSGHEQHLHRHRPVSCDREAADTKSGTAPAPAAPRVHHGQPQGLPRGTHTPSYRNPACRITCMSGRTGAGNARGRAHLPRNTANRATGRQHGIGVRTSTHPSRSSRAGQRCAASEAATLKALRQDKTTGPAHATLLYRAAGLDGLAHKAYPFGVGRFGVR